MDPATMVAGVEALIADGVREQIDDEGLVARCSLPFLITASSKRTVETIARRVHAASSRAVFPFVEQPAGALPSQPEALGGVWSTLMLAARGGSLLLFDIEETPPIVQGRLVEVLGDMHAFGEAAAVRVIAGTTVSLSDRIACGTFSESLFYRLNLVHLVANSRVRTQRRRLNSRR